MGTGDLSSAQALLLDRLDASELVEQFYLTGGTALSAFHLHHRQSEDLDLFSRDPFEGAQVAAFISAVADEPPVARRIQHRLGFLLKVKGEPLKVEFHYEFDCIEPPQRQRKRLRVDGLRDILANKLSAAVERTEAKDFVDLYFLLSRSDLGLAKGIEDCRRKFGWPGVEHLLQTAFLRCERFASLPETEPPLGLQELRDFFKRQARSLIRLEEA